MNMSFFSVLERTRLGRRGVASTSEVGKLAPKRCEKHAPPLLRRGRKEALRKVRLDRVRVARSRCGHG